MKKKILIGSITLVTLLIGISFIPSINAKNCIMNISRENNDIIYVDDDNTEGPWDGSKEHPYQTIKKGISNSVNGTTVFVFSGYYEETNLKIHYKSIKLIGEDKNNTIIDGKRYFNFIYIYRSKNVTFSNFTVRNGSEHHMVLVERSNNVVVSNNIIEKGKGGGICISGLCDSNVSNNIIKLNRYGLSSHSYVWHSTNNIISRNHFERNDIGIYLQRLAKYNLIERNLFEMNDIGIYLKSMSANNVIGENNFILNGKHAYIDGPKKNSWSGNFWNRPRLFPKIIRGVIYYYPPFPYRDPIEIKFFNIDWHPAQEPYDIGV
jgi:parallel beta-helix repeat protein